MSSMNNLNKFILFITVILLSYYVLSSLDIDIIQVLNPEQPCNDNENFVNKEEIKEIVKPQKIKEQKIKYKNIEKFDDEINIEGTNLLLSPLIEKIYNQNSVSNVNRNTSNDIRGDIPLKYSTKFTPFYSN